MKRHYLLTVVGLLSIAASASAAPVAPVPFFLRGGKAVCSSAVQTPAPLFKTLECADGQPCTTDNDCWAACSYAGTATCVGGEYCHYTAPGGSGSGGGGGTGGGGTRTDCDARPCMDSSDCGVCNTFQGVCTASGTCVY